MATTGFEKKFSIKLKDIPSLPGTYSYWSKDKIVYIGKAKNLRRRLSQYKNAKRLRRHAKMRMIVKKADKLTWETAGDHFEACVREVRLIQSLRPSENLESKFSFLYPMIGVSVQQDEIFLCLTTHPEKFPGYIFYGAYRSRRVTGNAFFSLHKIIKFLLSPASPGRIKREGQFEHSYVIGFRRMPEEMIAELICFLRGEETRFLENLTLRLIEKKSARVKKETIQEALDYCERFFRWEARRLNDVMKRQSVFTYPIAQSYRDILFLQDRIGGSC